MILLVITIKLAVSFSIRKSEQLTTTAEIKPTVRDKRPKDNSEIDWHGLGIRHTYTNLVCRENVETISYNFLLDGSGERKKA